MEAWFLDFLRISLDGVWGDLRRSPCPLSRAQDYPSVGQVAQALSAANIQPIFAVTSATLPVYQVRAR